MQQAKLTETKRKLNFLRILLQKNLENWRFCIIFVVDFRRHGVPSACGGRVSAGLEDRRGRDGAPIENEERAGREATASQVPRREGSRFRLVATTSVAAWLKDEGDDACPQEPPHPQIVRQLSIPRPRERPKEQPPGPGH